MYILHTNIKNLVISANCLVYLSPKTHKRLYNFMFLGRPIILNCGTPNQKSVWIEFLVFHFKQVIQNVLSYVRNSGYFLEEIKDFFLVEIHSMQGWTDTTRHGDRRKRSTKKLKHRGNLFKKGGMGKLAPHKSHSSTA